MRKVIETIDNKGEKGEYIGIFTTTTSHPSLTWMRRSSSWGTLACTGGGCMCARLHLSPSQPARVFGSPSSVHPLSSTYLSS